MSRTLPILLWLTTVAAAQTPAPPAKPPRAAPTDRPLAEAVTQLKTGDDQARREAALDIGRRGFKAQSAVPDLIERLEKDSATTVKNAAAEALGAVGASARQAVPALLKALKEGDDDLRETAAEALGDIAAESGKVLPALQEALKDKVTNVRCAAARALGDFRTAGRAALPALQEALKGDKEAFVREAARDAIDAIQRNTRKGGS